MKRGRSAIVAGSAAAALVVVAAGTVTLVAASAAALGGPADGASVELAPIVDGWPASFTVSGTKSEPLYVEHITMTRDGDDFAVRIEVIAQGDAELGTQEGAVRVDDAGTIGWTGGCPTTATDCDDDGALRGFLSTATVLGAARADRLPATGTAQTLDGSPVVCVDDAALHPEAPPALGSLEPCFSVATGAVLGHWSTASEAFVGSTLAPGFTESDRADPQLIPTSR